MSKSPSPTTVRPITEPEEKAILRPLLSPSRAPFAVREFAYVAIFIPTNPESPEKNPPVKNANGTNGERNPETDRITKTMNIITKNTPTVLYCLLRYAIAPWRIFELMSRICSVPSGLAFTL